MKTGFLKQPSLVTACAILGLLQGCSHHEDRSVTTTREAVTTAPPAPATESGSEAAKKQVYADLKSAQLFAINSPKLPSMLEREFRALLHVTDAGEQFRGLLYEGTPEAKLYGLLGLKLIEDQGYGFYSEECSKTKTPVHVVINGVASQSTTATIARRIAEGGIK
jgi:hypothetical protein